jgi:hypothetical protein
MRFSLWPAIWTMGNLGRAGYGGTLDGTWPYSYDSCDVGTLPNQTLNGELGTVMISSTLNMLVSGLPAISTTSGPEQYDYALSYLPGQRLSRCTCKGDTTHPGPVLSDGTFVGRAAPEIDMLEATVSIAYFLAYIKTDTVVLLGRLHNPYRRSQSIWAVWSIQSKLLCQSPLLKEWMI